MSTGWQGEVCVRVWGVSVFGRGLRTRSWLDGWNGHGWLMVWAGCVWVGDDVDDDDDTMGKRKRTRTRKRKWWFLTLRLLMTFLLLHIDYYLSLVLYLWLTNEPALIDLEVLD